MDLTLKDRTVLLGLPSSVSQQDDPLGTGVFLRCAAEKPAARHEFEVGRAGDWQRFTCTHRHCLFFMSAKAGRDVAAIPVETQSLLVELTGGGFALFLPLLDGPFRASLQGRSDGVLVLTVETGDPAVAGDAATALFVAVGENPFALMEAAARSVMQTMRTGRLREDKPVPDFADLFGWCTWDAFYQDVTHDKVRLGLESFTAGGVKPAFLILDDGWQSVGKSPTDESRLTAFAANGKFPGDLGPTVRMAREEFGVRSFLVWHAFLGYWGGVAAAAFPQYRVRDIHQIFSAGMQTLLSESQKQAIYINGLVAPEDIFRFYQDYHRHLRLQGVDGVKVDCQAVLEVIARGCGGRVAMMRVYHAALEGAAQTQFGGRLINCMSCSNDMIFSALNSTVTRSSTDFAPNDGSSHGKHLYANALASFWMGEFVLPDWDMFQSGHPSGAFHAAARAISGGPVYVSDKPDAHDFTLLRKLVLSDGTVPRTLRPARPTRRCLFLDPTRDECLLTVFSRNGFSGVIGAFNLHAPDTGKEIAGAIRPTDVEGLSGDRFAVYAHHSGALVPRVAGEDTPIVLGPLGCEVFTVAPIVDGFAPIGLTDKINSGGTIRSLRAGRSWVAIELRDGGEFLAWCERAPKEVRVDRSPVEFRCDGQALRVRIAASGQHELEVMW